MTGDNPEDIVGLLAYALFKKTVREEVRDGQRAAGAPKNPTPGTVKLYRDAAEQQLQTFAAGAIDEATPEVRQSAMLDRLETMGSELQRHVTAATGTGRAIWTNFLGWALTLAFSVLILVSLRIPEVAEFLSRLIPDIAEEQQGRPPN